MFKTIVVGVDGQEGGRDALSLAGRLARLSGAELVAVRAVPLNYSTSRTGSPRFVRLSEEEACEELEEMVARAGLHGRVRALGDSSPGRVLHHVAEEERAGLIVVGSTRHGVIGRVLAGDHAAGTVHASPCPVAVAPRGFATRDWDAVTRIGVGFDGRPEARQALAFAVELARESEARINVVSVVGTPVAEADAGLYDPEWFELARASAEDELHAALRGVDMDVEIGGRVVPGLTVDEFVGLSAHVDLLVVGSRGWGPVRRILVGSTAAHLMREAHCPVIVLPRGAATGAPGEVDPAAYADAPSHA
jgi:nucleotide-binding universal stress UspA family protein